MNEVIDFLTANTTLAYVTAVVIFIITIVLLVRRIIGVFVTVILLIFALLSGLAIANHDLFREILTSFKYEPEKTKEDTFTHYKKQLQKAFDEIKEEFELQARKIEALYEAYNKPSEKEIPAPPKPAEKP